MNMGDKIEDSYRSSRNIYDDVLTRSKWWSRLYMDFFWDGIDDNEIARKVLSYVPDDFSGNLLDVPVGTGVFTSEKYSRMTDASITCVDYSEDMLSRARERFSSAGIADTRMMQGDVGNLPFSDAEFDTVLCMNGLHVFPDKEKAFSEIHRVLKRGGAFIACLCIKGESKRSDWLMKNILSRKGWFTPPFETFSSLRERREKNYSIEEYHKEGSMVYFLARKLS